MGGLGRCGKWVAWRWGQEERIRPPVDSETKPYGLEAPPLSWKNTFCPPQGSGNNFKEVPLRMMCCPGCLDD